MVDLVKHWDDIEEHAKWCRHGAYQVRETIDGVEVRVVVGRYGYINTFNDENDELFKRIIKFCKNERFVEILSSIPAEIFFASHKPE